MVGYVTLYLLVTLNSDFLPQLKCAAFGAVKTALLRSGAPASGYCEHVSSSMRRQVRNKGGGVVPLFFSFVHIPCAEVCVYIFCVA